MKLTTYSYTILWTKSLALPSPENPTMPDGHISLVTSTSAFSLPADQEHQTKQKPLSLKVKNTEADK